MSKAPKRGQLVNRLFVLLLSLLALTLSRNVRTNTTFVQANRDHAVGFFGENRIFGLTTAKGGVECTCGGVAGDDLGTCRSCKELISMPRRDTYRHSGYRSSRGHRACRLRLNRERAVRCLLSACLAAVCGVRRVPTSASGCCCAAWIKPRRRETRFRLAKFRGVLR